MERFKKKFRFSETFTNESYKTSGSGFIGVITGLVGAFLIFAGVFAYFFKYPEAMEFLGVGVKITGLSAGLLAARKVGGGLFAAKNGKTPDLDDPPPLEEERG
jgi:hypothetical protein